MSALEIPAELVCTLCPTPKRFDSPVKAEGHRRWAHPTTVAPGVFCYECEPARHFISEAHLIGHRRYEHPESPEALGEECEPPPLGAYGRLWDRRRRILDSTPGRWHRWRYGSRTAAHRGAKSTNEHLKRDGLDEKYVIEAHQASGSWWVYGVRIDPEGTNSL